MSLSAKRKIVVFSGAGVSAESGLATFLDSGGLWHNHRIEDVATPQAWAANRQLVLDFYNHRRAQAAAATPNAAHLAIARLEEVFDVVVVTQNVDDLHERAGSTQVVHLHGELTKARSTLDPGVVVHIGAAPIQVGDKCPKGSQLRPHIVWFGEPVEMLDAALEHFLDADKVLVVGTSLIVQPAASLVGYAPHTAERVVVCKELDYPPDGFLFHQGQAAELVPQIVEQWMLGMGTQKP